MDPELLSASEPPTPPRVAADFAAAVAALPARDTASVRAVRRNFSRLWRRLPGPEILEIAAAIAGRPDLRWAAYEIVRFHPGAFALLDDGRVAGFAEGLDSWESVDAFGRTLSGPAWAAGLVSDALIGCWAGSPDRWLRRAALVSTIELRGAGRVLPWCRRLAADRDDMVVKALSWALRELAKRDPEPVRGFIAEQDSVLAARVRREVGNKLRTGLKNPKRTANAGGESPAHRLERVRKSEHPE